MQNNDTTECKGVSDYTGFSLSGAGKLNLQLSIFLVVWIPNDEGKVVIDGERHLQL